MINEPKHLKSSTRLMIFPCKDVSGEGSKDDAMYSVFLSLQCSPTREAAVSRALSRSSASLICSETSARSSA